MSSWRVLWSGHADAYTNMAVDEALLWAATQGASEPTLRLYGWRPAGVSLGYFQPVAGQVDPQEIARRGWGLVRRPTGGRAILHDDEITYGVVIAQAALERGESVMGSYREISRGLECGVQRLGVAAALGETATDPAHRASARELPAVCFAQAGRGDMVAAGRKIIGSAQVRRGGYLLQHGSIPLRLHVEDQVAVMPGPAERRHRAGDLQEVAVGLADLLGVPLTWEQVGRALVAGFAEAFGAEMVEGELTPQEQAKAEELRQGKYATEAWNLVTPGKR